MHFYGYETAMVITVLQKFYIRWNTEVLWHLIKLISGIKKQIVWANVFNMVLNEVGLIYC